jgi:HNH endonuclease
MQAPRHKIASLIKSRNAIGYAGCICVAFSESVKLAVRKRAHFQCCLCKSLGVEVHHVVPQSENSADTEENAAPLCPSCHETYGANPLKRKFITEARDLWYEICRERYASDSDRIERLMKLLEGATAAFTGLQPFASQLSERNDDQLQRVHRTEAEIVETLGKLFEQIWYYRNWYGRFCAEGYREKTDPVIWEQAAAAAAEIERRHGAEELGPWNHYEWGILNGQMIALQWVLGGDWDYYDSAIDSPRGVP